MSSQYHFSKIGFTGCEGIVAQFCDWEIAGLKAAWRSSPNRRKKFDLEVEARMAMVLALMFPDVLQREIQRLYQYCQTEGIPWNESVISATIRKHARRK